MPWSREANTESARRPLSSSRPPRPPPRRSTSDSGGFGTQLTAAQPDRIPSGDRSKHPPSVLQVTTHALSNVQNDPSPATSASEHELGCESRQPPKISEKATDPRRRATTATGVTRDDSPRSIDMADADDLNSMPNLLAQMAQDLAKFGDQAMAAVVQSHNTQRLRAKWTEDAEAKKRAEETFKEPTYAEYAARHESSSRKDFEEAAKEECRTKAEVYCLANSGVAQLSAYIRGLIKEALASNSNDTDVIETLQTEIKQVRDDLDAHRPAVFGHIGEKLKDTSEEIQKLREDFTTAQNQLDIDMKAFAKKSQASGTTQGRSELTEALRQTQLKSTPILNDCQSIKGNIDSAMANIEKGKVSPETESRRLRTDLDGLRQQNDALHQELATLKTQSVSRDEFALLKEELLKLRSTRSSSEPAPLLRDSHATAAVHPQGTQLDTEIQNLRSDYHNLKAQLNNLEGRQDSIAPLVYKQCGTVDLVELAHKRVDAAMQTIGSLKTQVEKANNNDAQASTVLSPAASPRTDSELLQHKELVALQHSVRALSARYNNLTSDTMAQQIARLVNPISANIQAEIAQMKANFNALHSQQTESIGNTRHLLERVVQLETNSRKIPDASVGFELLSGRIASGESALTTLASRVDEFQAGISNPEKQFNSELADLKVDLTRMHDALEEARVSTRLELASVETIKQRLDQAEMNVQEQTERQRSLSLKIDQHMHDQLEIDESLNTQLETVKKTGDQNGSKLQELEKTIVAATKNFDQVKLELNEKQDVASTAATAARDAVQAFQTTINGFTKKHDQVTSRLSQLDSIELKMQKVKESLNERISKVEHRHIQGRPSASSIPSAPPRPESGDSGKPGNGDFKPARPTGARALSSTPVPKNSRPKRVPRSSSAASTPAKRRADSPASDTHAGKKVNSGVPDGESYIVLSDDEAPPRLGAHSVPRGPN